MMPNKPGLYWRMITLKRKLSKNKYFAPFMRVVNLLRNPIAYMEGAFILGNLILHKKKDEIYLISCWGIGDSVYTMAYIDALLKKYRDKKIIVIGNSKYKPIFDTYARDRVIFRLKPPEDEPKWRHLLHSRSLQKIAQSHEIFFSFPNEKGNVLDLLRLSRKVFNLPDDTQITYHGLKQAAVKSIPNFEENKNRIVIINPYSESMGSSIKKYEKFCDELKRRGYIVYTNAVNASGNTPVIKGSEALVCDIYEFFSIACQIPLIVSVRSGILDLSVVSDVNMFVVYEVFENSIEYFTLTAWQRKGIIKEVMASTKSGTNPAIQEEFCAFLDELRKEGRIS